MSGEFSVHTDALRSHANTLDSIASSGGEAVSAGATVSTGGEAFGILCSFIGAALNPVEAAGVASSLAAVGSVTSTAVGIRATAAAYDAVDSHVGDGFTLFGGS